MPDVQKLYLPTLHIGANSGTLAGPLFENVLAYGPVYEIIVHDTAGWRELQSSNELVGGLIHILSKEEVTTLERNAEKFLSPLIEQIQDATNSQGERVPPIEAYRPMRNVLVEMQIGAIHRSAVCIDRSFLTGSMDQISSLRQQREELSEADEVFARLDALDGVIRAYRPIEVDGLRYVPEGPSLEERVATLQEGIFQAASEGKFLLGRTEEPLMSRIDRASKSVRTVLDSKWGSRVKNATDVFSLLVDGTGGLIAGGIGILADRIPALRLDRFAPPVVDDWPYEFLMGPPGSGGISAGRYGWETSIYVETPPKPRRDNAR